MSNEIRHLFPMILFAIYKRGIITFIVYIAFVDKWVSFHFLSMTSKDSEQSTEIGNYLEDIFK